jgi:hypothetical protein
MKDFMIFCIAFACVLGAIDSITNANYVKKHPGSGVNKSKNLIDFLLNNH